MGKRATDRPTIGLLRRLEDRFNDPKATEEGLERIVSEVKQAFDAYYERLVPRISQAWCFSVLFAKHGRSSGDLLDYRMARNCLIEDLEKEFAEKRNSNLDKYPRKNNDTRNMKMARKYAELKKNSSASASDLMKRVGKDACRLGLAERPLRRSAAIDAIKEGLRLLKKSDHERRS